VTIDNIVMKSPGSVGFSVTEFFLIGNQSTLTNVVFYVPTAGIHLHTGFVANNIDAVSNFVTVQAGLHRDRATTPFCACFGQLAITGNDLSLTFGTSWTMRRTTSSFP
jgi:hypothetical protein